MLSSQAARRTCTVAGRSALLRSAAVVQRLPSAGCGALLLRASAHYRVRWFHCATPQCGTRTHPSGGLLARNVPAPDPRHYAARSMSRMNSASYSPPAASGIKEFYRAIANLNASLQVRGSCTEEDILALSRIILRALPHIRALSAFQILARACVSVAPPMGPELQDFLEEVLNELGNVPAAVLALPKSQAQLLWILHWCAQGRCVTPAFRRVILEHLSVASACSSRASACTLAFGLAMLNIPCAKFACQLVRHQLLPVCAASQSAHDNHSHNQELLNVLQYAVLSGVDSTECIALLESLTDDVDKFVDDVAHLYNLLYRLIPLLGSSHPFTEAHIEQLRLSATNQESLELLPAVARALLGHVGEDACSGPFLLGGVHVQCVALVAAASNTLLKTADWPMDAVRGNDVDSTVLAKAGVRPVAVTLHAADSYLAMPRHCPNGHSVLATMSLRAQGYHVVPMMYKAGASGGSGDPHCFVVVPELLLNYPSDVEPFRKWQDGEALPCR